MGQEWRSSKEGVGRIVMYQYRLATLDIRRYGILEMLLLHKDAIHGIDDLLMAMTCDAWRDKQQIETWGSGVGRAVHVNKRQEQSPTFGLDQPLPTNCLSTPRHIRSNAITSRDATFVFPDKIR